MIKSSMSANIIPSVDKKKYGDNIALISSNTEQIVNLKMGFAGAMNVYEALFDDHLKSLQMERNRLALSRSEFQNKTTRLEREIAGITPRLSANVSLVVEFFPAVNVKKLEQVESFHQKIGSIVKKQLKEELALALSEEDVLDGKISFLDNSIQNSLRSKGMPSDLFSRIFDLKEKTDRAVIENNFYEQQKSLDDAIKSSGKRLDEIYSTIFLKIEAKINSRLKSFNTVVYGADRNSSELRIKSSGSYLFSSPDGTGTGKSFAGLIGFDLAMLSLTRLPFVIHDSVIYKNIEVAATKRILRIISSIKAEQIFISFDEAKKFGVEVERLIKKFTVLHLSHSELLYIKDWRDTK